MALLIATRALIRSPSATRRRASYRRRIRLGCSRAVPKSNKNRTQRLTRWPRCFFSSTRLTSPWSNRIRKLIQMALEPQSDRRVATQCISSSLYILPSVAHSLSSDSKKRLIFNASTNPPAPKQSHISPIDAIRAHRCSSASD